MILPLENKMPAQKTVNRLGVMGAAATLYEVAPPNQSLASANVSADFTRCNVSERIEEVCITRPT